MGSLVLTVVGTAVAGPFGGLVGGLVGTYLDQAFIFPALFGRPQGPRLEDLHVQTAAEGSNGRYILGPQNRTAGTLIWASDLMPRKSGSKKGPTTYTYRVNAAIAICQNEIKKVVRIWADSKVIYDNGRIDSRVGALRIYRGTNSQTVDPLINASDPGRTPAYRGTAYVVIENLLLTDWGNRTPNFSFEVVADYSMSVQEAILRITQRAGLAPEEVSTTRVKNCLRGYVVLGPQESTRIIDPLMTAFSLGARDDNGVLTFWNRGEDDYYGYIPENMLGARESGTDGDAHPVQVTDTRQFQLPSQVVVQHVDPDWDLQQGSQRERKVNTTNPDVVSLTLPITLTADDARNIAKVMTYAPHAERQLVEFSLPPSYIRVQEGDILTVNVTAGTTARVRVLNVTRGYNYVLRVQGHITQDNTYRQSSTVDSRGVRTGLSTPPALTWHILDIPAIESNHQTVLGFYVAAGFVNREAVWTGAQGFRSNDNSTYAEAWSHVGEATFGKTLTALGDDHATPDLIDNLNTVDVYLYNGQLTSVLESQLLTGANRIMIGDEIIGFRTATLIEANTYRLSGLLRGRRDTQRFITGHRANERVVLLDGSLVFYAGLQNADIGGPRYFRNVPTGADLADAPSRLFTPQAVTVRHFTPCKLKAKRDLTTDDCQITWVRRSRADAAMFSAPLLSGVEAYIVEIRYARDVVKARYMTNDTAFTFTASEQTNAGLTPGTSGFYIYVYQIGDDGNRSLPATTHYDPEA